MKKLLSFFFGMACFLGSVSAQNPTLVYGTNGITTIGGPTGRVYVNGAALTGTNSSLFIHSTNGFGTNTTFIGTISGNGATVITNMSDVWLGTVKLSPVPAGGQTNFVVTVPADPANATTVALTFAYDGFVNPNEGGLISFPGFGGTFSMGYNTGNNTLLSLNNTATVDLSGNFSTFPGGYTGAFFGFSDGGDKNHILSVYGAGTAYSLTAVSTLINFGTTDPALVIDMYGTYRIKGQVQLLFNGATFAAGRTVTLKLRRTNNTAADLTDGTITVTTPTAAVGLTGTWAIFPFEAIYTTANTDDSIEIFADVSIVPGAGSLDAISSGTHIIAERLTRP